MTNFMSKMWKNGEGHYKSSRCALPRYNKFDFMLQQQKEVFICPSILSADFGQLAKDC